MTLDRVLVIGGAGLVGSRTASLLAAAGHSVTVLDTFQPFADPLSRYHAATLEYRQGMLSSCADVIAGDASRPIDVLRVIERARPDRIIDFAAIARPQLNDVQLSDAVQSTLLPIANTFALVDRMRLKRFLAVSSSYVYGQFRYSPCDELHPCEPTTVYGTLKLSEELLTRAFGLRFSVPVTIARLTAVFGPSDLNGKLSIGNLRRAIGEGVLPIAGDTGAVTDYTYVDDAAGGLCGALFADSTAGETINISRGRGWTSEEVADALRTLGHAVEPTHSESLERRHTATLAIEKAQTLFGFAPRVDLVDGLSACLEFIERAGLGSPSSQV